MGCLTHVTCNHRNMELWTQSIVQTQRYFLQIWHTKTLENSTVRHNFKQAYDLSIHETGTSKFIDSICPVHIAQDINALRNTVYQSCEFPTKIKLSYSQNSNCSKHLMDQDKIIDPNFCRHYMKVFDNDADVSNVFMMLNEGHFHLNKYVDKQNLCFWAKENCPQLHEQLVHNSKITFWCEISVSIVIMPYLFQRTTDHYS
jgi:hypothetical protein